MSDTKEAVPNTPLTGSDKKLLQIIQKVKSEMRPAINTYNDAQIFADYLVGPQVRRLRVEKNLTQDALAAACQRCGWDIPRAGIGKIESRLRCVTDFELVNLSKALKCGVADLFSKI